MGYKYAELEVTNACYYRLCNHCFLKIQAALRQLLVRIRIAKLQETWGHVKQDMPAGENRETTSGL